MTKYICTQCTGRTDERHVFELDEQPRRCPYNACGERHITKLETYLRKELEDAQWDANYWEQQSVELREEKDELKQKVADLEEEADELREQRNKHAEAEATLRKEKSDLEERIDQLEIELEK